MDCAQFGRRAHVRLTLVAHDLVRYAKLFQQPQHALGAGIVEVMNGKHGGSPRTLARRRDALVVPARRGKVEMLQQGGNITRMLLTRLIYPGNIWLKLRGFSMDPRPAAA